jgi:hypothetical protein
VADLLAVAVGHSREHLLNDFSCVLFVEVRSLGNLLKEFTSRAQFSH